ncbi:type IV pilus biogenesis protein PilM [Bacillus sp. REN16]|uniref:type IV pilus biogenesis protein PilM n=1 Tax=Bacillus sp. REN16 TaxID=2887296 RepID=UPI001E40FD35|nr:pilus assembly protein PilM [Bacillus sp. REN16]MCC3356552.1 pilus assembly protein PilM [Bacillus sp. REN16]
MAFTLFSSNKMANIIIKDHAIRYVGVKQTNPITVQKFREKYLPPGIIQEGRIIERDTLLLILDECVSDWGIKKNHVQFVIPDPFVVIRKITIPNEVKDDEILGYIYLELGTTIHLPFEEPVIDFKKLTEDETRKEVLIIAAPEDVASEYSSLLEEVDLKPVAADITPLCMYRLFHFCDKTKEEGHSLLIQFDLQSVNLSIFHQDVPLFMRHITLETSIEDWDIQQNNSHTLADIRWNSHRSKIEVLMDELIKEIEHVMNFYSFNMTQGKERITNILMSGDHPYLSGIRTTLKQRYEIPVQTIDKFEQLPAHYYLPLGLALKEVQ